MKNQKHPCHTAKAILALAALAVWPAAMTEAADIQWTDGTASYTNAANWTGGIVPGATDNAINDNGTGNVVQINVGDPDWTVGQIRAGNSAGNGAYVQNGQTVTPLGTNYNGPVITEFFTPFRLGIVAADSGIYTLNDGNLNYGTGPFDIGEVGTGTLNINGGTISGSGTFRVNGGGIAVPNPAVVTGTAGHGPYLGDFTYYEVGYSPVTRPSSGLPAAGTTITSVTQGDHSYQFAPTYTSSDAVILDAAVPSATITLSTPTTCAGLSFLGSAGNGPVVLNYAVNHSSGLPETGSLSVPDWFGAGQEVLNVEGRVDGTGVNFQYPNPAGGNPVGNAPYLLSVDISLANSAPVTSINLSYVSGGGSFATATILGVSGQTNVPADTLFTPLTITGYNSDVVVEAAAPSPFVSGSITDVVNQTSGAVNVSGELWVGNGGVGIYNFTNGSINASNFINVGRSGGIGTFNMAGGTINKSGNAFVVGANAGNASVGAVGTVNQSAGTVNSSSEVWIGQANNNVINNAGLGTGTYNISGTAALNVTNWLAVGREGGIGVLNLSGGGSINKFGGGNLTITHGTGASGTFNQTGGTFTIASGEAWIGEDSGTGTWNMNGGTANVGVVHIVQNASATGYLNLNGGTMTLQELTTGNTGGISTLTLNGGTIKPSANNANFLHDLTVVNVSAPGGAVFDTAGFDVTVAQPLPTTFNPGDNSGGLTKNGAGTLTLSGANSYVGPTLVNAGKLAVSTTTTGGGSYTVADGAALGVAVQAANAQLNVPNLTAGTSTGASLNFDLGNFGNPGVSFAPLNASGILAANGTITFNIADALPQLGQFPLVKYGSLTGSATFTLGSVPTGVTASISNNVANNSIDLVIIGVNLPRWEGLAGGNWDIGITTNWINIGTGLPTFYTEGSIDLFDDNALGTTTVNLVTTVHPGRLTVTNNTLSYTLTGSGKISGSIGLTKQGTATLAIVNTGGNDFTGPVTISGGTLSVTNLANGGLPSPIGASSANPTNLVFGGGKLSYSGPPVSVNRGYTVTADGSTLETVSNLTLSGVVRGASGTFNKAGLGQLTYTGVSSTNVLCDFNTAGAAYQIRAGTVVLDGSAGAQTNWSRNTNLGADAGVDPTLILTNTTLVTRSMQLGNNATCTGTLIMNSNSTMTVAANNFAVGFSSGIQSAGVLTQNPGSAIDSTAELWVGQGALGTGTYNMNGGTALFRSWVAIGRNGGTATFNMTGGTITKLANNNFMIGSRDGTTGTRGTLNQSGGTILCGSEYWIGEAQNNASAAFGTNNISGTATLIVSNWIAIGREGAIGVLNLSGGSVTKLGTSGNNIEIGNGTGSSGTINQTGGAFNNTISETRLGTGAPGYWNLSGGTANLGPLVFCLNSGCTNGTLNLSGGVLTAREIRANQTGVANVSTLNWNGGTIAAGNGASANFFHNLTAANVQSGGAVIDSGTNVISIAQALLAGGADGGLTKQGVGTLYLNGPNTYTNTTLVSVGTLGGTGTIAGPVRVASGAAFAPGASIGTLTINNSLTLSNGSSTMIEVNLNGGVTNNDLVTGLTSVAYAGSLVVTNNGSNSIAGAQFKLFNASSSSGNFGSVTILPSGSGSFNPATGILTIAPAVPPTINAPTVSGGNLILTGTGGTPSSGYTWLTATNLTTPIASWTTNTTGTFSISGTFSNAIPITTSTPAQFFRLRTP